MSGDIQVRGRQPIGFSLVLWGAPLIFLATFAIEELRIMLESKDSYAADVPFLIVVGSGALLCTIPLFLYLRKVTVTEQAITGFRYLGGRTRILWNEVEKAELFEVITKRAAKRTFRLIPKRGRRLTFHSQMSNFDRLVAAASARCPVTATKHPSRPAVGPYEI